MTQTKLRTTELPSGDAVPVLGQGTWHLAEDPARRSEEIAALRNGLDLGMTLIDTAEMYADGGAETLVGEAIAGRRDEVFLVSKVLPQHATREGTLAACARSLARLGTEWIDLYLLHWRGPVPLEETLEGFLNLRRSGMIRQWGVSNFDVADLNEVIALDGGDVLGANQVLYNLTRRGIEYDLIPWCESHGVPIMAYSPIEQGRVLQHPTVRGIAKRHHATTAQVALAWVLRRDGIIAIPKAGSPDHVRENRHALDLHLSDRDMSELDLAFPPPTRKVPLEMI
jgi:diketogulonate reductase-like aldo/keto reductase